MVDTVLSKIKDFEEAGELKLPTNYSAANALKSAWLILQETKDRNDKPALVVCTKESVANALLDMVVQGLSPMKKQCYFIVYGSISYVQFRMFDTQVDGTEFDTCECMVDGTPYSDLNTAAKMNAGIDIINAICRAKGVTAPIWLDNRESVCNLISCASQIINLFVERGAKLTIQ